MRFQILIFSSLLLSVAAKAQEINNLIYANDLYRIERVFENKDYHLLALGNKEDRFQILTKDKDSKLTIYEISELLGIPGRVRLYDVWRSDDGIICATSWGLLKLAGDTILARENRPFDNIYPFNSPAFIASYVTSEMQVGYQLAKSKYIKSKYDYPEFVISNGEGSLYQIKTKEEQIKKTYFDLKDWDRFYDRTDLFRFFIDVLSDKKVLINFPGCNEAVLITHQGEQLRLKLDQPETPYESTYFFASADGRLILGVGYDGKNYQCYYFSGEKSKFIWFDVIQDQPLGIFSEGVYYRKRYENTYYHYLKPFDQDKKSLLLESVEFIEPSTN